MEMRQSVEQFEDQLIEKELIDEETGEILSLQVEGKLEVDHLSKLCRVMGANERRAQMIEDYRKREMGRIAEVCQFKLDALDVVHKSLSVLAEGLLRSSGETRLEYPGIGVVRIGHTRESVDTSAYDNMSDDEQALVQSSMPDSFRTKTLVSPDKKTIKAQIKEVHAPIGYRGRSVFSLSKKEEIFVFKADK